MTHMDTPALKRSWSLSSHEVDRTSDSGGAKRSKLATLKRARSRLQDLPDDWSLKDWASFTSSTPFEAVSGRSATAECVGLHRFVRRDFAPLPEEDSSLETATSFEESLLVWVFPERPLPPTLARIWPSNAADLAKLLHRSGEKSDQSFLAQRFRDWETSFRSAYFLVRRGVNDALYVKYSTFIVLFRSPRVAANLGTPIAVATHSTPGFRNLLTQSGVPFTVGPEEDVIEKSETLENHEKKEELRQELNEYDDEGGRVQRVYRKDSRGGGPALFFNGHRGVHGLFDVLLNLRPNNKERDVSQLLSSGPFLGASVRSAEIKSSGKRQVASASGRLEDKFGMEVTGQPLLPAAIRSLCNLFRSTQDNGFEARFKTDPLSLNVNAFSMEVTDKVDGVQRVACVDGLFNV
mmetsp:Transcript_28358/g.45957  ORF Transcript_28358/g.45957 Transcript_28358/m.45957 type:complete len:407 (-) Transcript_28358:475-1695(-)|eukprot:CAMPEP_0184661612 /NCGR_PEP_ID=MMETSP0308-20130426/39253_1 /TAXON_ID=38269 /ORGANISM="Gloeochaete witrockiana, Strain SAG 46.84" /LENGTH=406 /DNA_ID=CAMNT_0027103035 /DNA_START=77 /DNA_END=1297 /DNA_ORIENTATION=-